MLRPGDLNSRGRFLPFPGIFSKVPYWLLAAVVLGIVFFWKTVSNQEFSVILSAVSKGIRTTVIVSLIAYFLATLLGLFLGLMKTSSVRIIREIATFYIEIVRGIPMLVVLYYIAFVGAPALVSAVNWLISPLITFGIVSPLSVRDLDFVSRAVLALMIGYSAFIAEIFRAGIESVQRGQKEAAKALGLSRWQAMRKIILPQAVRNVLPPLANEFVAMIKDSALVSALGVQDITQLGKVYSSSTFRFFETYNIVAFLYLVMTISLSLLIKLLEKHLSKYRANSEN